MSTSVSNIPVYDATRIAAAKASDVTSTKDLTQDFLRLLTVQLQNQDPLNPMDNAAMTSQLAALNTVDGINQLNDSVGALVAQMQSANFMNLSGSVGKTVLSEGTKAYFDGSSPVSLAAKLDNPAASLKAVIRDATGAIKNQYDFGSLGSGVTDFIWDGYADDGTLLQAGFYTLELTATDAQGNVTYPQSYVGAMVAGIGREDDGIQVTLGDGRSITTDEILKWVAV
jgi:flagellar basal-body rod modification protein FlgD